MAREDNSLLLVATDCVASMGFQNDQNHPTYYADSHARAFLTGKFTEESFTPEQQQLIETRDLPTTGGDVSDKIFLLSDQEAEQYFSSDEQRKVSEQYFLRTANEVQTSTSARVIAMIVNGAGAIEQVNNSTDYDGGIRPAMWLNVSRYVDACQLLNEGNSEEATELLKSVNGIKGSSDIDYESMEKEIGKYQTALCKIQTEQNCTLKEAYAEIEQYPNRAEIYQEDAGIRSMINMLVKCEGTYKLGTDTLSVVFSYHEGKILAKVKYSGFPGEFIANESFTMLSNSGKLDDTIVGVKIRMGGANPNTGIFEYYTFTFIPDEVQAVSESTGKSVILKYVSDED